MTHQAPALVPPAAGPLRGVLRVPGDKSVAHRAVMFGALAEGLTVIENFGPGADNRSTLGVFRALGARIALDEAAARVEVEGRGRAGLASASAALDCGNSGTTMRLTTGLLAGLGVSATLIGDASLSRRPMRRIADPLNALGADVVATGAGGCPPLRVAPGAFRGGAAALPIASAQVKSALLLAALGAGVAVALTEPSASRDHTEIMLRAFGVPCDSSDHYADPALTGPAAVALPAFGGELRGRALTVPGDISSAAFLLVAASIVPGSEVRLTGCGASPTRTGVLDVLREVGVPFTLEDARLLDNGEPVVDILARGAEALDGFHLSAAALPRAIDEIPVLAVLAGMARGTSRFEGASELRVKESDRLALTAKLLECAGCRVEISDDDALTIHGRAGAPFEPFDFDPHDDHRMAAAAIVAAMAARGPCRVADTACLAISYPGLLDDLGSLQGGAPR